jgi:Glycosyl hydrolases family 18/Carbohydrate binding domain
MPRLRTALLAGATAAVAAAAVAVIALPAANAATNILANGDFEIGTLSGWSCDAGDSVGTGHAHGGSYALAGTPGSSSTAQCSQTLSVAANTSYTLTGFVNGPYVYLGVSGAATASTWTPGTGAYTQLTVAFTTGASTSLTVYVHGWYGQGAYYADDLSLTGPAGPSPTPSQTSRSSSPSASPSASPSRSGSVSPSPSTSVPPPPNGSFRNPIYFMPLDNSPQDISSAMSASGVKNFNLAFVLDSGGCTPAWGGDAAHIVAADSTVTGVVSAVRAAGGDVAVSFGGYNGAELGAGCGSASGLAAAYQKVITKYNLTRIDLDYEGDDLNANTAVRFGAIKILQDNARAAGRQLHVTLTVPMTTVGFPDTGKAEIQAAQAAGASFDLVNIMAFDYGLTNASDMATSVQLVADQAKNQMKTLYGYDDATAYAHLGLQLMNGHTDQPSELFTQATFTTLLGYAKAKHFGWLSFWALNRDRACDPSVPHNWADGTCSSVSQNPYDFAKILAGYTG